MGCESTGHSAELALVALAGIVRVLVTTMKRPVSGGSVAGQSQAGTASGVSAMSTAASTLGWTLRLSPHEGTNTIPEGSPVSQIKIVLMAWAEVSLFKAIHFRK
jgi:hypothetical protein